MTPRITALALSLLASSAHAQPARPDAVVLARVEAVDDTPLCGVLFSSPVARHAVLRVERGRVPPGALYAFYACGWAGGTSRVAPGMILRLSLTRRPTHSYGSTVDRMGDPTTPRFYVLRAETALAPP